MAIVFLAFGGAHDPAYNPSIVNISPKSFDKAKEFYTPLFGYFRECGQLFRIKLTACSA